LYRAASCWWGGCKWFLTGFPWLSATTLNALLGALAPVADVYDVGAAALSDTNDGITAIVGPRGAILGRAPHVGIERHRAFHGRRDLVRALGQSSGGDPLRPWRGTAAPPCVRMTAPFLDRAAASTRRGLRSCVRRNAPHELRRGRTKAAALRNSSLREP
jgi:hypothetical protein